MPSPHVLGRHSKLRTSVSLLPPEVVPAIFSFFRFFTIFRVLVVFRITTKGIGELQRFPEALGAPLNTVVEPSTTVTPKPPGPPPACCSRVIRFAPSISCRC